MTREFDVIELSVCLVCIHLLANGEFHDGTHAAEIAAAGMKELWGSDAMHLIADGEEYGCSTSDCDGCGNADHGDRYAAIALLPKG